MSLTLLYRGKNVRFSMQLTKLHWLSALCAFALISGLIVHLIVSNKLQPNSEKYQLSSQDKITQPHPEQPIITALTIKLAELQSQVLRLNALGDRLADNANIPTNEFNFSQLPASGGPVSKDFPVTDKTFEQLFSEIENFENSINHEEKQLQMLESVTFGHHIQNNSYLSGRPIAKGWLSSYYGVRKDPFNGKPTMHKGVDFADKEDTAIIATASGVVTWASKRYGYGLLVEINHGDGLTTRYGHSKKLLVNVGDVVNKGQAIARMGSTGRSTGSHVHYEILKNNKQINPIKFVYRKGK
ncbi:M23 family metallopeptidase [Colwellia ponticola]|uniref:M23 family metallopeptidase n=1 Tax=Colwellia ponticola TaxID=2304625 RepID=A0A8H2JPJ7_9GAMM|nr:M23 family metallopeptidase [Colwellia ponticola]TMM47734.1 M23 family metallopeptidase [Colwellia ponticola]